VTTQADTTGAAPETRAEMTFDFDGLIQLLAGHLYSEKKVFIRELIQNGHDAIVRRAHEDQSFDRDQGRIHILTDLTAEPGRIIFRDNGLGMSRTDLDLDCRLACLRHAAGLPPGDDKYHRQPDDLTRLAPAATPAGNPRADQRSASATTPAKLPDLATRLHQARAAAGWAMAYAQKLDDWLQCDWHQREVTARRERIEATARALGTPALAALGTPASAGPAAQQPPASRG
jgi:hypothetical protein